MLRRTIKSITCNPLFTYKCLSTFAQLYMASLIATNGSSEEPFIALTKIAHMGAWVAALRGIDALIDPAFKVLVAPLNEEDKKAVAKETRSTTIEP